MTTIYHGVWQPDSPVSNMTDLATFETDAGKSAAIVHFWRDWAGPKSTVDTTWLDSIRAHGSLPMFTWSPSNWDTGLNYTLASITAGTEDAYLTSMAAELAGWGHPLLIRTMHEMNGSWYAWGQQASAYIAAFRHIVSLFRANGATNVGFVWCPNVWIASQNGAIQDGRNYYPGDSYVDWVGLDGYNQTYSSWQTWDQVVDNAYTQLSIAYPTKPLMVAETASGEPTSAQVTAGKSKATWITDALSVIRTSQPAIRALVWFNQDTSATEGTGHTWPIESSGGATTAYAAAIADGAYLGTWDQTSFLPFAAPTPPPVVPPTTGIHINTNATL